MRIPWPEYINFKYALVFALSLMVAELMLGTSPAFAVCIFIYVMLVTLGVNIAGGMYTFSGSYIALQSLQSLLISQVAKVFFLQAADSNLHSPLTTVSIYTAGEAMLVLAAMATRKFRRRNPILDSRTDSKFTMSMSITGSLIGMIVALLVGTIGSDRSGALEGGSVWAYLVQLGDMLLIGVLLGTAHIIRSSNGTRSARWWTIIPMVAAVLLGIAGNSKQAIYAPLFLWIMCCAIYRYKFNRLQVGGLIAAGLFGVLVVFPVVQYSRAYVREGNLTSRAGLVWNFMRDHSITDIRESYTADEELKEEGGHQGYYFYYGQDEQVLDRVSLISVDDAVVTYTLQAGPGGYEAFTQEFISMVPRAFFPDKDRYLTVPVVNVLGRETGILGPSDETTYIAFSLFGPTYYMGGWWAVTVVTFFCMALFFTVIDSFYGDARVSLYALIAIGGNLHGAAELILPVVFGSMIHLCLLGTFTIWLLRKMAVGVQVFIQNYSWFEKSPGSLAPRRTFILAQPVNLAAPPPAPSGLPIR